VLRGTVDGVPMWLLLIAVVVAIVGLVLLLVWLVRRLVPSVAEGFDAEVASQMLGVVAALGPVVILGYTILVGSRSPGFHAVGAASIALVVGMSLVVLIALSYPFSGDLAGDPSPFRSGSLAQVVGP